MIKRLLLAVAMLCAITGAQVPVTPISQPRVTFVNAAGGPCAGCSLFSFAAGTTTPLATYVDGTGTSQNTNPIVLDAAGGAQIWLGSNSYKLILKDPLGATIWSVDQINSAQLLPCASANAIQSANSAVNALTCDPAITINTTNHTINIGTLPASHVTIGALGTPTSWNLDTTSPASAVASLKAQFTGSYTSGVGVNQFQVLEGGIDPSTEFNRTNGTPAETSSIYGGVVVPSASTAIQSSGVMGVAKNFSGLPGNVTNGVGGYFAGICMVNSCSSWGVNSLVQDAAGTFNDLIWGIEDDVNIYSSTTHGYGLDLIGRWAVQPTIFFPAIMVHKPVNFPGDTTGDYRWTAGLEFETGSIFGEGRGVTLNPMKQAVSQRSQLVRWNANNSAGITHAYSSYEDPFGNLLFLPEGGGPTGGGGSGVYDSFNVDGSVSANLAGTGRQVAARFLQPSLATSNFTAITMGAAETTNNAAFIQFANNGGTGSASNVVAIGLFNTGLNLTVDGGGNANAQTFNAQAAFSSAGLIGFTGTKTAGTCVFTITGGLITNVTGC